MKLCSYRYSVSGLGGKVQEHPEGMITAVIPITVMQKAWVRGMFSLSSSCILFQHFCGPCFLTWCEKGSGNETGEGSYQAKVIRVTANQKTRNKNKKQTGRVLPGTQGIIIL